MRKIITGVLVLAALWMLSPWESLPVWDRTTDTEPMATMIPVSPNAEQQQDEVPVTLYFRYMSIGYLAQERRVIAVPRDQTIEMCILRALMTGPSADHTELSPLFPVGVSVLRAQRKEDMLTVTLSHEFLEPPPDAPADWSNYAYWRAEVPRRRYLAVCAIANALTEEGRFSRVEVLISTGPDDTLGQRVVRSMFFAEETDPNRLMEPLPRTEAAVLTPQRAAQVALEAWQHKDWMTLYALLAQDGDTALPAQTDFIARMAAADKSLLNYNVSVGTVTVDGAAATVCIDVQRMQRDGKLSEVKQLPVRMARERDCWKITYETLLTLMEEPIAP